MGSSYVTTFPPQLFILEEAGKRIWGEKDLLNSFFCILVLL